jgi:peptide deformylase
MAVLPIVHFPDSRLKDKCKSLSEMTESVKMLMNDMVETMQFYPGCVGLAAPQVGRSERVIVMDVSRYRKPVEGHGLLVLANPLILEAQNSVMNREGCLSVADYTGNVPRFADILVQAWDLQGSTVQIVSKGFEAIVFQHEIDHLDGLLFLDRVSSLKTDIFRRKSYLH